jgi:superfamily I DNA and/or RNA helicase
VDEASKATATEVLVPLVQARTWVLVGDPKQLPPFVENALLRSDVLQEHELTEDEIRETLFDRFLTQAPSHAKRLLSVQHRMLPAIGNLISSCFYDGQLKSVPAERPKWLLQVSFPRAVMWYSTAQLPNRFEAPAGLSKCNRLEARVVRVLIERINGLAKWGGTTVTVAVLTGYLAQRELIDRETAPYQQDWSNVSSLEINTIDAFQGREADILIYSVTRSNPQTAIGFLSESRRLNVALSRGRLGLFLVGDHASVYNASHPNPFRAVIDYIREHPADCAMEEAPLGT